MSRYNVYLVCFLPIIVYVCMYIYIYIYIYTHTHTYIYKYKYIPNNLNHQNNKILKESTYIFQH